MPFVIKCTLRKFKFECNEVANVKHFMTCQEKRKKLLHIVFLCVDLNLKKKLKVSTNFENVEGKRSFSGNKIPH